MCANATPKLFSKTLENISVLHFKPMFDPNRKLVGFELLADGESIKLEKVYNFQFMNEVPMKVSNLYMGSETLRVEDFQLIAELERPCRVTLTGSGRCEVRVQEEK
jgi:hypothetical protein